MSLHTYIYVYFIHVTRVAIVGGGQTDCAGEDEKKFIYIHLYIYVYTYIYIYTHTSLTSLVEPCRRMTGGLLRRMASRRGATPPPPWLCRWSWRVASPLRSLSSSTNRYTLPTHRNTLLCQGSWRVASPLHSFNFSARRCALQRTFQSSKHAAVAVIVTRGLSVALLNKLNKWLSVLTFCVRFFVLGWWRGASDAGALRGDTCIYICVNIKIYTCIYTY